MKFTRTTLVFLAAGGSTALLFGAFIFQTLGYAPCAMCLWQRWPHAAAIIIGALALRFKTALLPALGALAAATTGGIGVYHTGVERDWWEGPTSCTSAGGGLGGLDGASLLAVDEGPKLIMCDQVSWELFSLSMASWNALFSFALAGLWILAVLRSR